MEPPQQKEAAAEATTAPAPAPSEAPSTAAAAVGDGEAQGPGRPKAAGKDDDGGGDKGQKEQAVASVTTDGAGAAAAAVRFCSFGVGPSSSAMYARPAPVAYIHTVTHSRRHHPAMGSMVAVTAAGGSSTARTWRGRATRSSTSGTPSFTSKYVEGILCGRSVPSQIAFAFAS